MIDLLIFLVMFAAVLVMTAVASQMRARRRDADDLAAANRREDQ